MGSPSGTNENLRLGNEASSADLDRLSSRLEYARRLQAQAEYRQLGRSRHGSTKNEELDRQAYEEARAAYGKLLLSRELEEAKTDEDKNRIVIQYLIDEQEALDSEITNPTELNLIDRSRRFGREVLRKFGNFLTSGSKKSQFVKSLLISGAAATAGGLTGGILATAIMGGVRYASGLAKGMAVEATQQHLTKDDILQQVNGQQFTNLEDALSQIGGVMQSQRSKNIISVQDRNREARRKGTKAFVVGAIAGTAIGSVINSGFDMWGTPVAHADTIPVDHDPSTGIDTSISHQVSTGLDTMPQHHDTPVDIDTSSGHDPASGLDASDGHEASNGIDTSSGSSHDPATGIDTLSHDPATGIETSSHDPSNGLDIGYYDFNTNDAPEIPFRHMVNDMFGKDFSPEQTQVMFERVIEEVGEDNVFVDSDGNPVDMEYYGRDKGFGTKLWDVDLKIGLTPEAQDAIADCIDDGSINGSVNAPATDAVVDVPSTGVNDVDLEVAAEETFSQSDWDQIDSMLEQAANNRELAEMSLQNQALVNELSPSLSDLVYSDGTPVVVMDAQGNWSFSDSDLPLPKQVYDRADYFFAYKERIVDAQMTV